MTAGLADDTSLCMRVVAVGAERGVFVAFVHRRLMDAVMCGSVLIFVTFLAGVSEGQLKIADGFGFNIGVGVVADVYVTIHTEESFFGMNG